jgi:hypothetical protein
MTPLPIFLKTTEVKRSFHCFAQFVVTLLCVINLSKSFRSELYASISKQIVGLAQNQIRLTIPPHDCRV